MSFIDQKQRIATEKDCTLNWGGAKPGERFRCYLCGHKFIQGDKWRWVYAGNIKLMNFLTCEQCDNNVLDKWQEANDIAKAKFWWVVRG